MRARRSVKEKVNAIEIDINKDVSEYKELNNEILVELAEIKKIIAVETSKNKNNVFLHLR